MCEHSKGARVIRVGAAINQIHAEAPDGAAMILLETTAGQGTTLGRTFEAGRVRRQDDRMAASARLSFAFTDVVDATLRYELAVNRSNVQYAFDDKRYDKQVVSLSLGVAF